MRRAQRRFEIPARATARKDVAAVEQPAPCFYIERAPLALRVGRIRPALFRPLEPADAERAHVLPRVLGVDALAASRAHLSYAQDQRAADRARAARLSRR